LKNWKVGSDFCRTVFDLPTILNEIKQLEAKTVAPDFWQDTNQAQKVSQRLGDLKEELAGWQKVEQNYLNFKEEFAELEKLEESEEKESLKKGLEKEFFNLEKEIIRQETKTFLGGKHDKGGAMLSVYSGAGGRDAEDWAAMLLRMYGRYAELRGWSASFLHESPGEEGGLKSATLHIDGKYAYGFLKGEAGVHRLVRISPFSAQKLRHTSFARIEILPDSVEEHEIEIRNDDLRVDTFRSSGPGGQNVNRRETAIRITHLPTGLVAACQSERSQLQNRERAMKLLRSKLYNLQKEKEAAELQKLKGKTVSAGWGNQIRSYVLHPYKMVKDLRTGMESARPEDVLDGKLDEFIEAELKGLT